MSRVRKSAAGACVAVAFAAAGCAAIAGIDGFDLDRTPPADAAAPPPDTSVAPDLDAGCPLAKPPEPPDGAGPEAGVTSLFFAMNSASYDTGGDAGARAGFDLDGKCTCPALDSCVRPKGTDPLCDGPGGRDVNGNAVFDVLFKQINANIGDILSGRTNLLFAIDGVDSLVDDPHVSVAALVSDGTPLQGDKYTVPRFDGDDVWTLDHGSAFASPKADAGFVVAAERFTDKAYISGGVLVARIQRVSIREGNLIVGSSKPNYVAALDIDEAVVTARLAVGDAGAVELRDGVIAGRVDVERFLTSLAVVPDPSGGHLCGSSPLYPGVRLVVCRGADIAINPGDDGKGIACGAMAMGIGFTAVRARAGEVLAADPIVNPVDPCGAGWRASCDAGP